MRRDLIATSEDQKSVLAEKIKFSSLAIKNSKGTNVNTVLAESTVENAQRLIAVLDNDILKDNAHIQELLKQKIALETEVSLREYEMRNTYDLQARTIQE